ncbi:CheR family methyltransferase [Xanthocytophaga flava]|uniref:CheR family methyltransferase n=1 Tax=Xanthocytophaga flava TaxID=3048013 RepID=UPI0028D5A1A2|nr:CheR family methyltransferase [Xanthocytophaga flavus]MDJ1473285.1 CheR family methyltransferase [Xanthocytophaga flavus]
MEAWKIARLSEKEFDKLSHFIFGQYGIRMNPLKKPMLESRLQKRLQALGMSSYHQYCNYLFSSQGQANELIPLVNVVTTNKTDFFREAAHFDFLTRYFLPQVCPQASSQQPLRIWSAGCSSGEEPYTMAMVMHEFARHCPSALHYSILGTDLSPRVLELAMTAVYTPEQVAPIPLPLQQKYFLRSKDPQKPVTYRIVPELRETVSFRQLNFMNSTYDIPGHCDIVFCRNVLIYFDKPTQEKVITRLCAKLREGGLLLLGHSESTSGMNLPLEQIQPAIYQKI